MRRLVVFVVLGCGACGNVQTILDRGGRRPDPLGSLEARDYTIQVYAGPSYTIYDANGDPLAEFITVADLEATCPELSQHLRGMLARDATHADSQMRTEPLHSLSGFIVEPR